MPRTSMSALAAVGGFIPIPHFLEPIAPLPKTLESMHAYHVPLIGLAIAMRDSGDILALGENLRREMGAGRQWLDRLG